MKSSRIFFIFIFIYLTSQLSINYCTKELCRKVRLDKCTQCENNSYVISCINFDTCYYFFYRNEYCDELGEKHTLQVITNTSKWTREIYYEDPCDLGERIVKYHEMFDFLKYIPSEIIV